MWNSKPKSSGCRCSKRRHHNPKVVRGICHGLGTRDAVNARIARKRLARAWLEAAHAHFVDDVDG
ncbi:MAG: hypothetical protein NT062_10100 [Proteobacteria bacterium]|nr:hypothetical protein [Pseudomonadota bacterium]